MYRAIDECGAGMAAALSSRFTVVTHDRRGRGNSDDTLPYAVQGAVDDVTELITRVGAPTAALGESSGAVLALEAVLGGAPITKLACMSHPSPSRKTPTRCRPTSRTGSMPSSPPTGVTRCSNSS
jgi:pimeloyl-ACP methyl ester carboxylesterase